MFRGSRTDLASKQALDACVSELLEGFGLEREQRERDDERQTVTCIGIMRGLGSQVGYGNNTRRVCWATPNMNLTSWSCEALNDVAWELMIAALRHLALCSGLYGEIPEDSLEAMADELLEVSGQALARESEIHQSTPIGFLIGEKLGQLREDLMHPLQPKQHSRQVVSRLLAFSRKAFEHVNWIVWRDTHFVWLKDSLSEGRVVQSSWGPADRWSELGAHDAFSSHGLLGGSARAPVYAFSNEGSQRQEILSNLLKKAHDLEGRTLIEVEIGVFKGSLSKHVLEKLPFVQLLGVDPYIGKDGTFPGDFSETLDPDMALAQAQKLYEGFPDRAQLLPTTSEEAARSIPDRSLDAIFVDGCHLYECVESDLKIWLPKLGPGGLVAGHDFSPQWPGVVRAVHEHRIDGKQVNLGMDWTYWWYVT